ncbi:MAG TPA: oligosaccharide flippase family protein [Flavipsychrobacter sp.]|nr:oligosaccharide flippase family protein [Flavipsychrobacter sp.]
MSIKKLAGQTVWYGLSNIAAKLLNYILTPIITYLLNSPQGRVDYGDVSMLYAAISFANIVFTYGLETGYFRFSTKEADKKTLFHTLFNSLLGSTVLLSLLVVLFRVPISEFVEQGGHPEYIVLCAFIIAFDTLSAIPFARLRQEGRPKKYAFVRITGIIVNIILTLFFIYYSPSYVQENPASAYTAWYKTQTNVSLLLLANLAQNIVTFLFLWKEWKDFSLKVDVALWKKVMRYSTPMLVIGLGGMVNETIDRLMLPKLLPVSEAAAKTAVGIYSANYKLAIFITLFIQGFRLGAEPFFFSQAKDKNAPQTYARVMKWFVITLCVAFLFTALYLDVWVRILGSSYRSGVGVVPILLGANIALGIYYNLSVWYKVTDKMRMGIYITLIGAAITLSMNYFLIPVYGMYACAWATFSCYTAMMVISYILGQKYFTVPYDIRRIGGYLLLILLLFGVQRYVTTFSSSFAWNIATATFLMTIFLAAVFILEKTELQKNAADR